MTANHKLPDDLNIAVSYFYNLYDTVTEHQLCEVPQEWLDRIDFAASILEKYPALRTNQDVEYAMEIADDLKCRLIPLTYGQTDAPPVKHVTI